MKNLIFIILLLPFLVSAQKKLTSSKAILPSHSNDVDAISISARGQIATGSWDKKINIYKDDSTFNLIKSFEAHLAPVTAIKYSRDGGLLASGSNDHSVRIWDSTYKLIKVLEGHNGNINTLLFDYSRKYLLSGSDDRNIVMWELASGKKLRVINTTSSVNAIALNPQDNRQLIVAGAEPKIRAISLQSNTITRTFDGHTDIVNAIDINISGTIMISGSNDKSARLWDLKTGKEMRKLPVDCWKVTAVALSEDGNYAFTGCNDGSIKVWEVSTGKLLASAEGTGNYVRDIKFSKSTNKLLAANMIREGADFGVSVWETGLTLPEPTINTSETEVDTGTAKIYTPKPATTIKPSNAAPKK
jgi:tricorn protease-like protein